MKKLLNTILSDKLIIRVISPEKAIDGPGFLTVFLFQTVLASAAGLITGKSAAVFVLTLFLFTRLVRARMNTAGYARYLSIPIATVMSAGVTFSVMMERCMIYFYDYALLTRGMTIESPFMHHSVIAVRGVIGASIILTLLTVILFSIYPAKEKSWSRWMKKYSVPVFSLSGTVTRTSYIYLLLIIQIITIVIAVITSSIIIILSLRVGGIGTPGSPVIPVLTASSLIFILLFFMSICALLRRLRALGRSWPFLILVLALSAIAGLSFLAFNPASTNLLFTYAGERIGLSLLYWYNFYLSPVVGEILAGIRVVWACIVLYLTFYPGRKTE